MIKKVDLVVIGGGSAGMSAALKAYQNGIQKILLIERDFELGGILNQCIHDGFGLIRFKQQLSGPEYTSRFIEMIEETDIEVLCNTMVLEITEQKEVYACSKEHGLITIQTQAIILAMGCRERTRSQVNIVGSRPSGVLTAGAIQKYINIDGYLPGKKAVILGSGDIGLIMARRMSLEGMDILGVYEIMSSPGGLKRNLVQCLEDYNIPLFLSTTIVSVHGHKRLEGVTVAQVDEHKKIIVGTEQYISCDLLVLSVGLIPENELSRQLGIQLHPKTQGPIVDENMMTSKEGIFAAGNVVAVFDLVDYVSQTGETAALGAVNYINFQQNKENPYIESHAGENVAFVLPQKIYTQNKEDITLYLRVQSFSSHSDITVCTSQGVIHAEEHRGLNPPEMIVLHLKNREFILEDITINIKEKV